MNAPAKIDMPLTRESQKLAALAEVRARKYREWQRITAELQAEERRIEREFA